MYNNTGNSPASKSSLLSLSWVGEIRIIFGGVESGALFVTLKLSELTSIPVLEKKSVADPCPLNVLQL